MDDIRARFDAKWRKDETTGCWNWTASTAGKGYGQVRIPKTRRNVYAHRLSWGLHRGEVPDGMMVLHKCDNPLCVNPAHLFLGDGGVNLQDMAAKGRHLYGERNTESRLTAKQVHAIHDAAASGSTQRAIAEKFGVGQMQVCRILRGERWRHIFEERRRGK